jgi:plasmid stabilization system protein ParE
LPVLPKRHATLDPLAEADLEELGRYIKERDGEIRAAIVIDRIEKRLRTMAFAPRMGRAHESIGARLAPLLTAAVDHLP